LVAVTVHVIVTLSPALIPPLALALESRAIFQRSFIPARIERVVAKPGPRNDMENRLTLPPVG